MELNEEQIESINRLIAQNIHFGAYKRFTEVQLRNTIFFEPTILWEKQLLEKTGDIMPNSQGQEYLKWSDRGKQLVFFRNWYAYLDWEKSISKIQNEESAKEYIKALDLIIKQQQAKLNDIELKMKPVNYTVSIIALIVSGISLLLSSGLLSWILKQVIQSLKH